jgi:hypothetical protein
MLLMLAVAQFVVAQEIVDAISDDDGIPFYRIMETGIPTIIENAKTALHFCQQPQRLTHWQSPCIRHPIVPL